MDSKKYSIDDASNMGDFLNIDWVLQIPKIPKNIYGI